MLKVYLIASMYLPNIISMTPNYVYFKSQNSEIYIFSIYIIVLSIFLKKFALTVSYALLIIYLNGEKIVSSKEKMRPNVTHNKNKY